VDALLLSPGKAHAGGLEALRRAGGRVAADAEASAPLVDQADVLLDGIVGIGGKGQLRPSAAVLAARARQAPCRVVAVDVPSGVNASTGEVDGAAVHADVTVTFGALKTGLLVAPGAWHAGVVELVDIGLGPHLPAPDAAALTAADVDALLPRPVGEMDKYGRGVLGVVAGSETYTGAAVLTVGGGLRAGAGMVRFVSTGRPVTLVRHHWPEAVTTVVDPGAGAAVLEAGRVQAWVVGPGLGQDEDASAMLAAVLPAEVPVLVDADGLNLLASDAAARKAMTAREAPTLLTPHAGELARVVRTDRTEVEAHRLDAVRRAADELGVTVLLKGSTTLVADPGGGVRVNPTGTPYLGTAGSGDVLSGVAGSLLAQGLSPLDAGTVAAWLHGVAARLASEGGVPVRAGDLLDAWSDAVRVVRE
jgi:ADP-dependent NAD(P)H-hydrate dehydratase / NAD(P)H-hydrate epimerase